MGYNKNSRKGDGNTEDIIQSLKDAGCDKDKIEDICRLCNAGQVRDAIRVLRRHRCGLMDNLHESQNRVDCLDYLVYKMEKELKKRASKL